MGAEGRRSPAGDEAVEPAPRIDFELMETIGHLLRRSQQLHASLWSAHLPGGLTSQQFALMLVLLQDGALDQKAAGERASLDRSTATDIVQRLVGRAYIVRTRDAADGRRNRLELTDAGLRVLQETAPLARTVNALLLERIPAAERGDLIRLLNMLIERPASG